MIFPAEQIYCVLDYETFSEADLKKVGAFQYAVDPSTEILCVAWRIGTREELRTAETHAWVPDGKPPVILVNAMLNPRIVLVAQNALFEQVITRWVLSLLVGRIELERLHPRRWLCTAALAAAHALPRNLEGAAKVLRLPVQKDMEGNRLIKKWCKPRKATKKNPKTRWDNPAELARIVEYCKTDIGTTVELLLRLRPLSAFERRVWILDQEINLRGFLIDRPMVQHALRLIDAEMQQLDRRTQEITLGVLRSTSQRGGVLEWLQDEGVELENLTKLTVETALKDTTLAGAAREMLEIRAAASKTSTAKYVAFEARSRHDGRVRDILMYHAASTGRWGGTGVQPQNLPRPELKKAWKIAERLTSEDLESLRLCYGSPMNVFSSCLRSVIIAPEGKTFDVGDYASIEVRVLFWVAKHEAGLRAFREGRDLYKELASEIFAVPVVRVNGDQRFLGKTATLGCGYGLGWRKFQSACENYGVAISEELAQDAVKSYRSVHRPVVMLWSNIERAAISAIQNPGKKFTINRTSWHVHGDFLWCTLPSGRRLAYFGPGIKFEKDPWGEMKPVLYHWGVDSLTKKWVYAKTYGGKLVENVVQAISRDVMADAMLRIEEAGPWDIVLSVHDELAAERDEFGDGSNAEFLRLMEELPPWADGLVLKVEGWSGRRYRKG